MGDNMSRTEEKELNITRVIKVAQELFLKNGIANTSVNTIAREAGLAPMSVYRYFGTKDELVNRTWQDALVTFYEVFMERYAKRAEGLKTGYEKYNACMDVYFEIYIEFPEWYKYTLEMFASASDKRISETNDMKKVFWDYCGSEIPIPALRAMKEGQLDGSIKPEINIMEVYQVMLNAYTAPSIFQDGTDGIRPVDIVRFTSRLIANYIKSE